jgi:hypothetical protein
MKATQEGETRANREEEKVWEAQTSRPMTPDNEERDVGTLPSPNPAVCAFENVDDIILSSIPPTEGIDEGQEVEEKTGEADEEQEMQQWEIQEIKQREQASCEMVLRPKRKRLGMSPILVSLLRDIY